MCIKATIVAYVFSVQCFTIVAYVGLRVLAPGIQTGLGIYSINFAVLPSVYLSPCVYMSPALIRINMVSLLYSVMCHLIRRIKITSLIFLLP